MTWIWIPIVAILAGVMSDYIKMRSKQTELGADSGAFKKEIEDLKTQLKSQKEQYEQRIANLETIVTSQSWDALEASKPDPALKMPDLSISDAEKAELLAEKIK